MPAQFSPAQFSIMVEPALDLVRIEMGGFFSEADIGAFRFALETRMAALTCEPNQHVTLCDVSAMKIQTQDIVTAFSKVVGHATFQSRRLAFVTVRRWRGCRPGASPTVRGWSFSSMPRWRRLGCWTRPKRTPRDQKTAATIWRNASARWLIACFSDGSSSA